MEPKIIYQDEDIIVLDKPAGLTVNKADTTVGEKTVQEWVENNIKFKIPNFKDLVDQHSDFVNRAGIVHRIDKETSGILLVAKNEQAFGNLQQQFKERKVKKTYLALVHGEVYPEEGEINVPVGRLPWSRKKFGILAGGRESITKFKVLKHYSCHPEFISGSNKMLKQASGSESSLARRVQHDMLSILELYPKTGRTHQIRVHLKYFNHPIFSDPLYAGRKISRNDRKVLPRLFLHASKISFYHPKLEKLISFESSLPEELSSFLKNLS